MRTLLGLTLLLASLPCAPAPRFADYGPNLEAFQYPYPVKRYTFRTQAQIYSMLYMDVAPAHASGRTVVLLSGQNFCAGTWERTIARLQGAGYRVIAPDQIGFCKSSKPVNYQYSFQQLATNTRALLDMLKAGRVVLVGHSLGGMLAIRYALMFPGELEQLVLVDPLGLEDWKAEGALYQSLDEQYATYVLTTPQSLKRREQEDYFNNAWKPEYDRWLQMMAGLYTGAGRERFAWNQALISDMLFTQPVVYELEHIRTPTLIMVGGRDRNAPFRRFAPPEAASRMGNYPQLARDAVRRIPGSRLVEFADLGHAPQVEDPVRFNDALLKGIERPAPER
ncbi:MAG TPA: alpha/beta hydrolase [Steroidobacteraceae bacterium]|nr:alpha/beta hydrolase [Steroidobacteraceae bacterium]